MKVLFINSNVERNPFPVVPLGLCYVASNLEGHTIEFLDLVFKKNPEQSIIAALRSFRPDVVCVGIRNIDNVDYFSPRFYLEEIRLKIIDTVKAHTCAKIIIGGSAVNISPERVFSFLDADFGIYGEGEESLNELLQSLEHGSLYTAVQGLVYKKDGEVVCNGPARVRDLSKIKFPRAYRWVQIKKYARYSSKINIQTKRGCPLHCSYCVYNRIEGSRVRLRPPEAVADEIADAISSTGIRDIEFTDSVFNVPLSHASAICREIIKRNIKANFSTMGINPKFVTPEFVRLLEDAGFNEISVTPESASQKVIDGFCKGFMKEDIIQAAALLEKSALNVIWYFMFGGPGETSETAEETIDFIKTHIPPHHLILSVGAVRIYSNTALERIALEEGVISGKTDLLYPTFYQSQSVAPEHIKTQIQRLIQDLPNCIALEDNNIGMFYRILSVIISGYLRATKSRTPIWKYLIQLNRIKAALK